MLNLDRLGVTWYRSKLSQDTNFLKHIWNIPGYESNNQELIHAHQKRNEDSAKWHSPSIPSENVSELLDLNTVNENNYK